MKKKERRENKNEPIKIANPVIYSIGIIYTFLYPCFYLYLFLTYFIGCNFYAPL